MPYIILKEKTPAATVTVQGFMTVVNNPVINEVELHTYRNFDVRVFPFLNGVIVWKPEDNSYIIKTPDITWVVNDFEKFGFKVVATHSEVTGYTSNVKSKLCITMRKSD